MEIQKWVIFALFLSCYKFRTLVSNKCHMLWVCFYISALVIGHETRISSVSYILSSMACLSVTVFPHFLIKSTIFGEKIIAHKLCAFISYTIFVWNIFILRRIQVAIIINLHRHSCKVPLVLVRFLLFLNFLDIFFKNPYISNLSSWKSVRWQPRFIMRTGRQKEERAQAWPR